MSPIPFKPARDSAIVTQAAEVLSRKNPASDTPETDAVNTQGAGYATRFYAMKTHARKLERERNEARVMVSKLKRQLTLALEEIAMRNTEVLTCARETGKDSAV